MHNIYSIVEFILKRNLIGIGSYAYRYNVGINSVEPDKRMDVIDFIRNARSLNLGRVLICENLGYMDYDQKKLESIRDALIENEICAEVGMRDVTINNLKRHIEIADILGSDFIRLVLGKPERFPHSRPEELKSRAISALKHVLPILHQKGIKLGIENHFDLPTKEIVGIADRIDDDHIGFILDTTNGIGFIERVEETAEMLMPRLMSLHIKDYVIEKAEAGYEVKGTLLGEGILDRNRLLRRILTQRPEASIILELTIGRCQKMSDQEILVSENQAIKKSVKVLQDSITAVEYRIKQQENAHV